MSNLKRHLVKYMKIVELLLKTKSGEGIDAIYPLLAVGICQMKAEYRKSVRSV